MWSNEILPVESKGTSQAPDLVEQLVAAVGAPGQVCGQDPAEQLPGPLRAADDPRALAVGEDRRMPRDRTLHRTDPVQGEAPLEELQIPRTEAEPLDRMGA